MTRVVPQKLRTQLLLIDIHRCIPRVQTPLFFLQLLIEPLLLQDLLLKAQLFFLLLTYTISCPAAPTLHDLLLWAKHFVDLRSFVRVNLIFLLLLYQVLIILIKFVQKHLFYLIQSFECSGRLSFIWLDVLLIILHEKWVIIIPIGILVLQINVFCVFLYLLHLYFVALLINNFANLLLLVSHGIVHELKAEKTTIFILLNVTLLLKESHLLLGIVQFVPSTQLRGDNILTVVIYVTDLSNRVDILQLLL